MAAFYFVVLLSVISVTEACKCAVRHPQTTFCAADFVIRAKVVNESLDERIGRRVYQVKILNIFNGDSQINQVDALQGKRNRTKKFVNVYTDVSSASCGVRLDLFTKYVLAGSIRDRKMRIASCDWALIKKWTDVTDQQRRGLRRFYGQNCECRIEKRCFGAHCSAMLPGCEAVDSDYRVTECKKNHSFCVMKAGGLGNQCEWKKTPDFTKCVPKI